LQIVRQAARWLPPTRAVVAAHCALLVRGRARRLRCGQLQRTFNCIYTFYFMNLEFTHSTSVTDRTPSAPSTSERKGATRGMRTGLASASASPLSLSLLCACSRAHASVTHLAGAKHACVYPINPQKRSRVFERRHLDFIVGMLSTDRDIMIVENTSDRQQSPSGSPARAAHMSRPPPPPQSDAIDALSALPGRPLAAACPSKKPRIDL
jgi:hypothetical protein